MIRDREEKTGPIEIDLTGSDGNAYVLLEFAKKLARALDIDYDVVYTRMTEGDYENLVNVFDEYFGDFVILYR